MRFSRKAKPAQNRSIRLPEGYAVFSTNTPLSVSPVLSYTAAMRLSTHMARQGVATTVRPV